MSFLSAKYNQSGEFKMTHQATANRLSLWCPLKRVFCFQGTNARVAAPFVFVSGGRTNVQTMVRTDGQTDIRTDTMRENNDHRGLVGY